MSDAPRAEDLRARLEAAGATLTPEEFARLLPLWEARERSWARLRREDLGDTPSSMAFSPLPADD